MPETERHFSEIEINLREKLHNQLLWENQSHFQNNKYKNDTLYNTVE